MSNFGFIKRYRSTKSRELKRKHPSAFLLLDTVAENAKWDPEDKNSHPLLECGEAIVTAEDCGLSDQQFETARRYLEENSYIEIVHRGRRDKNSKLDARIKPGTLPGKLRNTSRINGTVIRLIDSSVYDINLNKTPEHIPNQTRNTSGKTPDKEEIKNKEKKEEIHTADLAVVESDKVFSVDFNEGNVITDDLTQHNIYNQTTNSEETENKVELKHKKSNKSKIKKSKEPNPDLVERRSNIHTSDEQHKKLIEAHGEELVNAAYDHLERWKESKKEKDPKAVDAHTDYYRITQWVFKAVKDEKVTDKSDSNTPIENNKKYAKQISENYQSFAYTMEPLNQAFEFTPKTSGRPLFVDYELSESIFKEKVQEKINTLKFKEIGKT